MELMTLRWVSARSLWPAQRGGPSLLLVHESCFGIGVVAMNSVTELSYNWANRGHGYLSNHAIPPRTAHQRPFISSRILRANWNSSSSHATPKIGATAPQICDTS